MLKKNQFFEIISKNLDDQRRLYRNGKQITIVELKHVLINQFGHFMKMGEIWVYQHIAEQQKYKYHVQ